MNTPRPWQTLDTQPLQDCAVFHISRTRARSPRTGKAHTFYRIDAPDWVNVVPVTPEGDIVMVRQFRHGSGDMTLEIPGGMVDPGETPAEAAARELLEETGCEAEAILPLGVVNPNPALFGNRCHTFLARATRVIAPVRNDGAEETTVQHVPRAELAGLLKQGAIDHALVIAALHWYALAGSPG